MARSAAPTEAAVEQNSNREVFKVEARRKSLLQKYKGEKKFQRSISPLYQPYMGKMIQISVNGITIYFPVDGSMHEVPETFAIEIDSRINAVNTTLLKKEKMAKIEDNFETSAGEITMF